MVPIKATEISITYIKDLIIEESLYINIFIYEKVRSYTTLGSIPITNSLYFNNLLKNSYFSILTIGYYCH